MNAEKLLVEATKRRWKTEIEKAINKVKLGMIPRKPRTKLDEWFKRRYYIETARLRKYAEQGNESGRRLRTASSHREEQTIGGELK